MDVGPVTHSSTPIDLATLPLGHGQAVLAVDDEPDVLGVICAFLEEFDYTVLTASSGAEALALFDAHRADIALVLTDMVMAGMDGSVLIAALAERDPTVQVIVLTGYARSHPSRPEVVKAWLTKPVTLGQLATALGETQAVHGGQVR